MDVETYRQNSEKFLSELEKEYYFHFSGQKDSLNIAEIYSSHGELFSPENFEFLKSLKEKSLKEKNSGDESKRYAYLVRFCGEGLIEQKVKELIDEIGEVEAKAVIDIDGKEVSFRYSEVLLSNEADKSKRDLIDDKRNLKVETDFNPKLYDYWSQLHEYSKNLGFASYRELFAFLKGENFYDLSESMEKLLEQTAEIYESHFGKLLLRETGIELSKSIRSDFAFLRRAAKYDRFFRKGILVDLFRDTLEEMGIILGRQPNIILDVEERKNKSPRAFCCTVRVPEEIYLVVMPKGGQDDFEAMFHEGGHAEHFANARKSLDFEYRFLGDNAVTEGYAFALEHLMQNKQWLISFLKMSVEDASDFVYFSNVLKLWFLRRYAGKFKYELLLHDGSGIDGKDELYRDILTSCNLMQYSKSDYLKDVDEAFYCTNYIRAWIFEAQLKDYMHKKFGYDWFKKKKAGDFLREIWSYGQKYNPLEIIQQLDYKELDINYLIDSIHEEIRENQ
ncbi:MAG: hypothetical protein FJW61_03850 [Actinobacteria bacterium]|nr:hypothetical protein [Actinomycetota bacterium]